MAYWIMKSEPETYSWDRMMKEKVTGWDGVRNYQAANNMKAMKKGDRAFFYHSGEERRIVGIIEIVKEYHPDPTDPTGRFGMVAVRAVTPVKTPLTLAAIKAEPRLGKIPLVRQSRLSVSPLSVAEWTLLCRMAGVPAK